MTEAFTKAESRVGDVSRHREWYPVNMTDITVCILLTTHRGILESCKLDQEKIGENVGYKRQAFKCPRAH